jgi:hypothetical protein
MANTVRRLRFRNCMAHSPTGAHSARAARPPSIFIVCKSPAFALQRAIPARAGFFHLTRGRAGHCLTPRPALEWPHAKANPPSIRRPPATNAGKSIIAISEPAPSPRASATRTTPTFGNGAAASIPARIPANIRTERRRHSTTPAHNSNKLGRCSCRSARRPISKCGVMRGIGTCMNPPCGNAGELLPSQKPNSIVRCPCGATFDSHDPSGSYIHRVYIHANQTSEPRQRFGYGEL